MEIRSDEGVWLPIQVPDPESLMLRGAAHDLAMFFRGWATTDESGPGDLIGLLSFVPAIDGGPAIVLRLEPPPAPFLFVIRERGESGGVEICATTGTGFRLAIRQLASLCGFEALAPVRHWWNRIAPGAIRIYFDDVGDIVGPPRQGLLGATTGMGNNAFPNVPDQLARMDRARLWLDVTGLAERPVDAVMGHRWPSYVNSGNLQEAWVSSTGKKLHAENQELCISFREWCRADRNARGLGPEDVYSVAASDGAGGWSEIPMSPSDAQLRLAICASDQGEAVAIYAYGFMSPAPTITVPDNVWVVWQTAHMQPSGTPAEALYDAYAGKGAQHFLYGNYACVWEWSHGLPGQGRVKREDLLTLNARMSRPLVKGYVGGDDGPCLVARRLYWAITALARQSLDEYDDIDFVFAWDVFVESAFGLAAAAGARLFIAIEDPAPFDAARDTALQELVVDLMVAIEETGAGADVMLRARDIGAWAIHCHLWRVYWDNRAAPMPTRSSYLQGMLRWNTRIRHLDVVDFTGVYTDPVLQDVLKVMRTELLGVQAGAGPLTPSQALELWGAEVEPTVEEVRGLLAGP